MYNILLFDSAEVTQKVFVIKGRNILCCRLSRCNLDTGTSMETEPINIIISVFYIFSEAIRCHAIGTLLYNKYRIISTIYLTIFAVVILYYKNTIYIKQLSSFKYTTLTWCTIVV